MKFKIIPTLNSSIRQGYGVRVYLKQKFQALYFPQLDDIKSP